MNHKDVMELAQTLRRMLPDRPIPLGAFYAPHKAADALEAQATKIERLTRERDALRELVREAIPVWELWLADSPPATLPLQDGSDWLSRARAAVAKPEGEP